MTVNLDHALINMAAAYIVNARQAFGEPGSAAVRVLMDATRLVLKARPPELITAPLTIIVPVGGQDADLIAGAFGSVATFSSASALANELGLNAKSEAVIVIAPDRSFRLAFPTTPVDYVASAASAIVYHRKNAIEWVAAGDSNDVVLKVSEVSASAFADPTLSGLEDALEHYGRMARETACELLKPVWEGGADGPRLVLSNKPERLMRESLFQALSTILRKADVTREHMVNTTKPVDIRVSWHESPAEALIEIKWIGRSVTAEGSKTPYLNYGIPRAQEGADQLSNYLDLKKSTTAKSSIVGYLVVYDARRRKVGGATDKLAKADALAFEHSGIPLQPDHSTIRDDFKTVVRWFMQPRASHFLEAA